MSYCDPFFPVARKTRKYDLGMSSVPCTAESLAKFDALVISTAHKQFKDPRLYAGVKLVIDSRNTLPQTPGTRWIKA